MRPYDVIERAIQDPVYAAELAAKAGKAGRTSSTSGSSTDRSQIFASSEWQELLEEFADSPAELLRLTTFDKTVEPDGITTTGTATTTTTITTVTSLPCGITTTTTTTTVTTTTTGL